MRQPKLVVDATEKPGKGGPAMALPMTFGLSDKLLYFSHLFTAVYYWVHTCNFVYFFFYSVTNTKTTIKLSPFFLTITKLNLIACSEN